MAAALEDEMIDDDEDDDEEWVRLTVRRMTTMRSETPSAWVEWVNVGHDDNSNMSQKLHWRYYHTLDNQ